MKTYSLSLSKGDALISQDEIKSNNLDGVAATFEVSNPKGYGRIAF